jgi:hypothetical protein
VSGGEKRLEALYPALSATERALLVLQAVKEDRDADPAIRWTMPAKQQPQYHRLIGTINALNCELASVIFILHEQADKVALRFALLQTLHVWSGETTVLGKLLLAQGKALPVGVRRDVRNLVRRAPSFANAPFDLERPFSDVPVRGAGFGDELVRAVAFGVRNALLDHWREIRSIEIVVEAAREEFDGEDPLHPDVRRPLEEAKAVLVEVHAGFEPYVSGIELPEPGEDEVALVRRLVEKAIENG